MARNGSTIRTSQKPRKHSDKSGADESQYRSQVLKTHHQQYNIFQNSQSDQLSLIDYNPRVEVSTLDPNLLLSPMISVITKINMNYKVDGKNTEERTRRWEPRS
jgi:hypothetical protein